MVPTAAERSNVLVRWTARSWSAAACTCDSAAAVRGPEIRFLGPFSRVSVLDTNKHVLDHRTSKRIERFVRLTGYDRGGGRPCVRGTDRTQHVRGGRWTGARALMRDGDAMQGRILDYPARRRTAAERPVECGSQGLCHEVNSHLCGARRDGGPGPRASRAGSVPAGLRTSRGVRHRAPAAGLRASATLSNNRGR
jgi:hypothetical protein